MAGYNSTIVDVGTINSQMSKVDQIYTYASKPLYYVLTKWSSPIAVESGVSPLRIEANILPSTSIQGGWSTDTVNVTIALTAGFTGYPVVTATYEGSAKGVTIRTVASAKDRIVFYVTKKDGKWVRTTDTFKIHFIAMGY
jgi:hypothetical protein